MFASSYFDHVDKVLKCHSIECVWDLHAQIMKEYGFDRLLYISTQFRTHGLLGDLDDALVLTNRAKGFVDQFIDDEMYKHGPKGIWAKESAGVRSWNKFKERYNAGNVTEGEKKAYELNAKWGLKAGYVISFEETGLRNKSVIGLCAREGLTQDDVDEIWRSKGTEIIMLNNLMHLKVSCLPHTGQRRPLTSRQLEALEWIADGKIMKDVAAIMDISPNTVEKHLRSTREALCVETTAQAVQKAERLNLLFQNHLDDSP